METKYTEKLARYLYALLIIATVAAVCWCFRNILAYIAAAALVTLLSQPIFRMLGKIRVKGITIPAWLRAIVSILVIFGVIIGALDAVLPLITDIAADISAANLNELTRSLILPMSRINRWLMSAFPRLGNGFRIESILLEQVVGIASAGKVSSVVSSITSFLADAGIAVFSVFFISFFFVKEQGLMSRIVLALVNDKYEEKATKSIGQIKILLPRYFIGLAIEVTGVALLNFLGLLLIAGMGLKYSLGIALMTGILNIIPYVGPLIGGVLGGILSIIIKYACVTSYGMDVGFGVFVLVLAGIFIFTQLVDNYVYQPIIYSNSVKVHPLEIFIVFLIAGHLFGIVGMLIAIPAYTVVREVAKQFLGDVKVVRRLTGLPDGPDAK